MGKDNVYIHTMDYYSATKKKEVLLYATTWLNIEDVMLSEINQVPFLQLTFGCRKLPEWFYSSFCTQGAQGS